VSGFVAQFVSTDGRWAVVVEDDDRVGYAYLLNADDQISGDVWLYNRCAAPQQPEWPDRDKAPFANPASFVGEGLPLPSSADDMSVEWDAQASICTARIFIQRKLAGVVMDGAKPGWAALARKDGPLAKVLSNELNR